MAYWFRIPSLPKTIFEKMGRLVEALDLSQRQVVIAGVLALLQLGETKARELAALVKEEYAERPRKPPQA